jgi:hypothetical protein
MKNARGPTDLGPPVWWNGRKEFLIADMSGAHILNTIKKLLEGNTSRRSVFKEGKRHPKFPLLIKEAAKRGLCLKADPTISGIQKAVRAFRQRPSVFRRPANRPADTDEVHHVEPAGSLYDDDDISIDPNGPTVFN